MQINRYTQPTVSRINPLNFQEAAFTPMMLRQRHDETMQSNALLQTALGNIDVLPGYQEDAQKFISPMEEELNQVAQSLASDGITKSGGVKKIMDLAARQQKLFSPTGEIGQLQDATQRYRNTAKEIQEFFKDMPELSRGVLNDLKPADIQYDEQGRLQIGDIKTPAYYKHIPDSEIMKQLNDAATSLKPTDLGDLGITGIQSAGSFHDLITAASQSNVSFDRLLGVMSANLSPEAKNSIMQYSERVQGIPRDAKIEIDVPGPDGKMVKQELPAGLASFYDRMITNAMSRAYTDTSRQRFMREDSMGLYAAKKAYDEENKIPFTGTGGRLSAENVNMFSKLQVNDKGELTMDKKGVLGNTIYLNEKGQQVPVTEATVLSTVAPGQTMRVLRKGYKSEDSAQSSLENQLVSEFNTIKQNNPELKNLSNKEALEKIARYTENITQRYDDYFTPKLNTPEMAKKVISMALNSPVFGPEGNGGQLEETVKKLGYKNVRDFEENGADAYGGLRKFGPNGRPAYEFTTLDKSGKRQSMYVEATDAGVTELSQRSTGLQEMLLKGELYSAEGFSENYKFDRETGERIITQKININPIGAVGSEPYILEISPKNTNVNLNDILLPYLKGATPERAKQVLRNMGYNDSEFIINSLQDINKLEKRNILKNLDYLSN